MFAHSAASCCIIAQDVQCRLIAVTLRQLEVDARQFPQWAMGSQASVAGGGTGAVSTAIGMLTAQIDDASLRAEFEQFAMRHAA